MRRTTPLRWLVLSAISFLALGATLHATTASARPWLGVYTQEITDELRDGLDLNRDGVLVNRVVPDGPADRAGVRKGDVIVSFNSRSVDSPSALADLVGDAREGQTIALAIVRSGQTRTLSVTLAARPASGGDDEDMTPTPPEPPDAPEAPETPATPRNRHEVKVKIVTPEGGKPRVYRYEGDPDKMPGDMHQMLRGFDGQWKNGMPGLEGLRGLAAISGRGRLGVRIESLSDDLASALGVPDGDGVLVLEIIKDTPAEKAGLRAGDVIVSVDGHPVKDSEALIGAIREADGKVSITVARKGARRTVEAELQGSPRSSGGDDSSDEGRMGDRMRAPRARELDGANGAELRKEMEELRQQLRELRRQLEEKRQN